MKLLKKGAHHSLANLTGCLLHFGHYPGCLFEDGVLYDVTKDGTQGYVCECWHPWWPAEEETIDHAYEYFRPLGAILAAQ